MAGSALSSSSTRFTEAVPRWKMLITQPTAMMGQMSMIMYVLKATNWPTSILWEMTRWPPASKVMIMETPRTNSSVATACP